MLAADGADDVEQAGAGDLGLDHLGGQRDAGEQPGELAGGLRRMAPLLLQDVVLDRDDLVSLLAPPPTNALVASLDVLRG